MPVEEIKNPLRIKLMALMLVMLGFTSLFAQVPLDSYGPSYYTGFDASFGIRNFTLNSNLTALNKLNVTQEGQSLGGAFGNNLWITKFRGGLYNSNCKSPYDINLIETEGLINLYPFNLEAPHHRRSINFYVTAGGAMDLILLYGNYLDVAQQRNYSQAKQPYLGRISLLNLSAGAGIEYRIRGVKSFGHFFAEFRHGIPIFTSTKQEAFKDTNTRGVNFVNVGFSYGLRK